MVLNDLKRFNYTLKGQLRIWVSMGEQRANSNAVMSVITAADEVDADVIMANCLRWRFDVDHWVEGRQADGKRLANVKWFDTDYANRKANERTQWGYRVDRQ